MKLYELSVLVHPDLESKIDSPIKKLQSLIADNGGKVVHEENSGKKRLAYTIKGQDFAVYLFWDVQLPAEALAKIQNTLNITDEVLRYLLVEADEKGRAAAAESKKRQESREEDKE